jgi:lysyl endopeptidase
MKLISSIAALMIVAFSFAQQGDGGTPFSSKFTFEPEIPLVYFAQPDVDALLAEDELIDGKGIAPWRFGYLNECNLNINNAGQWFELPNGGKLWMLQVHCENALTINVSLQNSRIPFGNQLFVYHPNREFVLGRFVERHLVEGALGCELVAGTDAIIEYYVAPENINNPGHIEIASVTHGYRTAADFERAFGSSGSCNMNVNCPDGQALEDQRNAVVMLVSGNNGFCTGSLINNTANDGTPYVLTANHCGSSGFANWIFRFNWQAENCINPSSSPSFQSLSGSVSRANRQASDFRLLEITGGLENETVPQSYNPFFPGWDNSGNAPTSTFCIHHPSGDIKKIAFDDDPAVVAQYGNTPDNTWRVVWDRNTTTEPGSSGSPLFDQNGRIIGQLWGGGASCTNLSAPDYYGRVSMSWNPPGSTNSQQLKHWLDPENSDVLFINGFPNIVTPNLDARLHSDFGFLNLNCDNEVAPTLTIFNEGSETITEVVINYWYLPQEELSYTWQGNLNFGNAVDIELPVAILEDGNYTFTAIIESVNGISDENSNNNLLTSNFSISTQGFAVELVLQLDCWGDEVSWRLLNQQENEEILTGGPYDGQDGQLINETWCLAEACYVLEINDSYGDGIGGGFGCNTIGYLQIIEDGNLLNEIPQAQANFGSQRKLPFCIGEATNNLGNLSLDLFETLIFPNPTDGTLNFAFNMMGQKQIKIYTAQGAIVFTHDINSTDISFQLDFLSVGIYFVEIRFGDHIEIQKLVKH